VAEPAGFADQTVHNLLGAQRWEDSTSLAALEVAFDADLVGQKHRC
jgi:hypothetical protein